MVKKVLAILLGAVVLILAIWFVVKPQQSSMPSPSDHADVPTSEAVKPDTSGTQPGPQDDGLDAAIHELDALD
jgi:hypothetical protein